MNEIQVVTRLREYNQKQGPCSAQEKKQRVVYNHRTGGLDWWTGLVDFVLEITFVLSYETSLSFINLVTLFSLFKHEVNNCSATTVVKPRFTLLCA